MNTIEEMKTNAKEMTERFFQTHELPFKLEYEGSLIAGMRYTSNNIELTWGGADDSGFVEIEKEGHYYGKSYPFYSSIFPDLEYYLNKGEIPDGFEE